MATEFSPSSFTPAFRATLLSFSGLPPRRKHSAAICLLFLALLRLSVLTPCLKEREGEGEAERRQETVSQAAACGIPTAGPLHGTGARPPSAGPATLLVAPVGPLCQGRKRGWHPAPSRTVPLGPGQVLLSLLCVLSYKTDKSWQTPPPCPSLRPPQRCHDGSFVFS